MAAELTKKQYEERLKRQKALVSEVVGLVLDKHGGFSKGLGYVSLGWWDPGMGSIQVDGVLSLNDLKILTELLELPSCSGPLEDFDFKKYEELRDSLKLAVERRGHA